jgi:hypothetical protein
MIYTLSGGGSSRAVGSRQSCVGKIKRTRVTLKCEDFPARLAIADNVGVCYSAAPSAHAITKTKRLSKQSAANVDTGRHIRVPHSMAVLAMVVVAHIVLKKSSFVVIAPIFRSTPGNTPRLRTKALAPSGSRNVTVQPTRRLAHSGQKTTWTPQKLYSETKTQLH